MIISIANSYIDLGYMKKDLVNLREKIKFFSKYCFSYIILLIVRFLYINQVYQINIWQFFNFFTLFPFIEQVYKT